MTPGAAKIALPESVASPSEFRFGINVESPTSAGDMKELRSMAPSRTSRRSSGTKDDVKGDIPIVSVYSSHSYVSSDLVHSLRLS